MSNFAELDCEECGNPMHEWSFDGDSGWACDSCGWSIDNEKENIVITVKLGITWKEVLYHHAWIGDRNKFWEIAKQLDYPYFAWSGWVYETKTGQRTETLLEEVGKNPEKDQMALNLAYNCTDAAVLMDDNQLISGILKHAADNLRRLA